MKTSSILLLFFVVAAIARPVPVLADELDDAWLEIWLGIDDDHDGFLNGDELLLGIDPGKKNGVNEHGELILLPPELPPREPLPSEESSADPNGSGSGGMLPEE